MGDPFLCPTCNEWVPDHDHLAECAESHRVPNGDRLVEIRGLLGRGAYGRATSEEIAYLLSRLDRQQAVVEAVKDVQAYYLSAQVDMQVEAHLWAILDHELSTLAAPIREEHDG
jgi:hypothetical protein